MKPIRVILLAVLACSALAHGAPEDDQTLHLTLTIRDATALRQSPAGRSVAGLLTELGVIEAAGPAWSQLSSALQLSGGAFDPLVGRRLTLVIRRNPNSGPMEWVVISEVSARVGQGLGKGLKAAPRTIEDGQTILSLERGEYSMAVSGCRSRNCSTLLFAPAQARPLFDEFLPALATFARAGDPVLPAALVDLEDLDEREIHAVLTFEPGPDQPRQSRDALWVSLGLADDGDWEGRLVATPGLVLGSPSDMDGITPWDAGALEAFEDDALVAVLGVRPSLKRLATYLDDPLSWLDDGAVGLDMHLGEKGILVVTDASDDKPDYWMTVGVEVSDADNAVGEIDGAMASLLRRVTGEYAIDAPDFEGVEPAAIRRVELDPGGRTPFDVMQDLELAWGVRSGAGWWVTTMGHRSPALHPSHMVRMTLDALSSPASAPRKRICVGLIRPRQFIEGLDGIEDPAIAPLRWIETVRWDSWVGEHGLVEGSFRVRMRR